MNPSQEHISFVLSNLQKHGVAKEGFPPPPGMCSHPAAAPAATRRRAHAAEADGCEATAAAAAVGSIEEDIDLEGGEFHGNSGGTHFHTPNGGTFVNAHRVRPVRLQGRSCLCVAMAGLWTTFVVLFVILALAQSSHVRMFDPRISDEPGLEKRLARDGTIKDTLKFGIWDSQRTVTPLQLQVAISMALGVRAEDDDVDVRVDENYFFEVVVRHATIEEVEYSASDTFLSKLNVHLSHYGGNAVLSHPPKLLKAAEEYRDKTRSPRTEAVTVVTEAAPDPRLSR